MLARTSTQSWRPVAPTALILIVTSPGCFNSCPLQRPSMNTTHCFPGRCQLTSADHNFLLHRLRPAGTHAQRGAVDGSHTFHPTSVTGRQYAFTHLVGKLPLTTPTSAAWNVHGTGALGQLRTLTPLQRPVMRASVDFPIAVCRISKSPWAATIVFSA